jgi:hypothetical protein
MNKKLMQYVPKEYKNLVTNISEGEPEYNEITGGTAKPVIVEWENGETSTFQNKGHMRAVLKEFHSPDEYRR